MMRKMKTKKIHNEVRFHLSRGVHYLHWQVKVMRDSKKVDVYYVNPDEYQLEMIGCKLANRPNKAKQVFEAGVHDVSGWVKCDEVRPVRDVSVDSLEKLYYNPIKDIRWRRESDCGEFAWDNYEFGTLITNGKQVYVLEERSSG